MPGNPSFYFTLFKKFQALNHVQAGTIHGQAPPVGGFSLKNPSAVFGASNTGHPLAGGDTTPSHVPLWAILNNKAVGGGPTVTISGGSENGTTWPTMPLGTPSAWTDFQVTPTSHKLVDVFADWITAGQINDVPTTVIANIPPTPIAAPLDSGVSLFVCSMPNDVGVRPDAVPSNFWETSLIYLIDPTNGQIQTPASLAATSEWYLAGIIGNRGDTNAGNYLEGGTPSGVQTACAVMVWNTTFSPGVELPSLSNLDVTDSNPIFEQYFLNHGTYDIVGFRLNVQTVYDGVIAALDQAVMNAQIDLGGLTADQWVHTGGAHLCAKVLIRQQGGAFPNVGDSPITNSHLAQKNLAPFDLDITDGSATPNIVWKTFVAGQPYLLMRLPGAGRNSLKLELPTLPKDAFRFYIGIPSKVFARYFQNGGVGGFRIVPSKELCESPHGNRAKPFPDAIVLEVDSPENLLEFPALLEHQFLGMALGIEWDRRHLKPGPLGDIRLVHRAALPKLTPGTRCLEIEDTVAGGFTIALRAVDWFQGAKGRRVPFKSS